MHTRSAVTKTDVIIAVMILLAIIVGAVAVLRTDIWGEQGSSQPQEPDDDFDKLKQIDPELIWFGETMEIPVRMQQVRALAVGPNDRIYVAGDTAVHVFDSNGETRSKIALDDQPRCLTIGGVEHASPGRIYVGMKDHVEIYDAEGTREAVWESLGEKAVLTSIATAPQGDKGEEDVFVADAGNRIVLRYDTSGELLGRIGERDESREIPGFVIIKPYFDLAVAPDGLLRVVNPRALRIEAYTFDGDLVLSCTWGKSSPTIEGFSTSGNSLRGIKGFFGCCNPAHFAILPPASRNSAAISAKWRFVTAEKGVARVKIYSAEGKFQCVVAGPEQLALKGDDVIADVAADSRNRILVLDPGSTSVRVFEQKKTSSPVPQSTTVHQ